MAQDGEVVLQQSEEHLGTQVLPILGSQTNRARLGRMVDHMNHQPHKAVYERLPRLGLALQAACEQITVNVSKGHD